MSVAFTETMRGFYAPGAPGYDTGDLLGRADGFRLAFRLTISAPNVAAVIADPNHQMAATGTILVKEFGPTPRPVADGGTFGLFAPARRGRYTMRYRLPFHTMTGTAMTLLGHKDVGDDHGPDLWPDTTTLYTRLLRGHVDWPQDATGRTEEYGRGILRLTAPMFARQLTTLRGESAELARFGVFFGRQLFAAYRGPYRRYSV